MQALSEAWPIWERCDGAADGAASFPLSQGDWSLYTRAVDALSGRGSAVERAHELPSVYVKRGPDVRGGRALFARRSLHERAAEVVAEFRGRLLSQRQFEQHYPLRERGRVVDVELRRDLLARGAAEAGPPRAGSDVTLACTPYTVALNAHGCAGVLLHARDEGPEHRGSVRLHGYREAHHVLTVPPLVGEKRSFPASARRRRLLESCARLASGRELICGLGTLANSADAEYAHRKSRFAPARPNAEIVCRFKEGTGDFLDAVIRTTQFIGQDEEVVVRSYDDARCEFS